MKDLGTILEQIDARLARIESLIGPVAPGPRAYKRREAAKRIGISLSKLKQMIAAKEVATVPVGRQRNVPEEEVARLTRARAQVAGGKITKTAPPSKNITPIRAPKLEDELAAASAVIAKFRVKR